MHSLVLERIQYVQARRADEQQQRHSLYHTGQVRATLFSMSTQSNALGQIAGGPVVGAIGTVRSMRVAFFVAGCALLPSLPLLVRTLSKQSHHVESSAEVT